MGLTFDGVTPTVINFDGVSLTTVICDGVIVWTSASPYTWVNNYVGYENTLTINVISTENCKTHSAGQKLSSFNIVGDADDHNTGWRCKIRTNEVKTNNCNYMTIKFYNFSSSLISGDTHNEYFKIISSNGDTLATYYAQQYLTTVRVDVSSASSVYIEALFGAYAYNGQHNCVVQEISFHN